MASNRRNKRLVALRIPPEMLEKIEALVVENRVLTRTDIILLLLDRALSATSPGAKLVRVA